MSLQQSNLAFDKEATTVLAKLPAGPTLVIIGSTSFWHGESETTCAAVGGMLATIEDLVLITGGMTGIAEGVGRSFFDSRRKAGREPNVFHVLPHGCAARDYGVTLFAGLDMAARREVLARLSRVYLAIEGGPGTIHEGQVALGRDAIVIPVGRSGGYAGELYTTVRRPAFAPEGSWRALGNSEATPDKAAEAVYEIVINYLQVVA